MNEEKHIRRHLPRNITSHRGDRTQSEVGAKAGVTRQAIWRLERGRTLPSVILLVRLARVLGCRVDRLLGLDKEE